ncbi:MAG: DUF427 domain-containing protein [Balneolaceae bacterium]
MWSYTGNQRPSFAKEPKDGEESVWDYPRPPALQPDQRLVEVRFEGKRIAQSRNCFRVLETASPPTFYLPPGDVNREFLEQVSGSSYCEWKGSATYWDVVVGSHRAGRAAWSYHQPSERFREIDGFFSFYAANVDCFVDGEAVRPQGGGFYGGWVTDEIVGPWKGEPDTGHW